MYRLRVGWCVWIASPSARNDEMAQPFESLRDHALSFFTKQIEQRQEDV